MTETITGLLGTAAPGIITGIVLAYWNRQQKRRDDTQTREATDRVESEMMRLDLEVATAQLSYATAMAVKRGTANGEMEPAIGQYEKAMEKFRKFERKQMAKRGAE